MKVTPKQEWFCQEYLKDLNATQAAIRAKYSKKTANEQGARLLVNVSVQKRVQELMKKREKRTEVTQDRVLEELAILACSDFRDYGEIVKELGIERLKLKMFSEIKGNATRAIKSISEHITKDGIQLKFKLHGKEKPLELLGKHLGMFVDKIEHSGQVDHAIFMMPRPKKKEKDES